MGYTVLKSLIYGVLRRLKIRGKVFVPRKRGDSMNISAISEITANDLAEYLRLPDPDATDLATLSTLLVAAKTYVKQYTGRTDADLDGLQDMIPVVLVLVQDMWDTRSYNVDNSKVNAVVDSILGMHSVNLLPEVTA